MALYFEWDEPKNAANLRKHGLAFEEAVKLFDDPLYVSEPDRIQGGEQRWQSFGLVGNLLLVMVAHTWSEADGDEIVRIISARYASKPERQRYEQNRES